MLISTGPIHDDKNRLHFMSPSANKPLGYLETIETPRFSGDRGAAISIEEHSIVDNNGDSYESEHVVLFSLFLI